MDNKISVKEFSDKHGIPYATVYAASFNIPYRPRRVLNKERWATEEDLRKYTIEVLKKRREAFRKKVDRTEANLRELGA